MSLTIIESKRKSRRFLTYDFEWIPGTLQIRLCGLFDGDHYTCFATVKAFLSHVLTKEYRGAWLYAHAGGLADVQFIMDEITSWSTASDWEISAGFSGSSAVIVSVRRKGGKNVWHFIDSFRLLPDSLERIGKWIGLEKLAEDERHTDARNYYANAPQEELRRYNERDCAILWHAIHRTQAALFELGGQLQMTLASCAMHLFRRHYLGEEIWTKESINETARKAYFASRVEVLSRECDSANYYDINSSFPYAMTFPCPGNLIAAGRTLPDSGLFLADCDIDIPEMYLPPVPIRDDNRVFFPTGKWRCWLSDTDIGLLIREGGQILKVHECLLFEPFSDLAEFAKDLYAKRRASESDFERVIYKLVMNSLYGKFAESSVKAKLLWNPKHADYYPRETMLFPGAYLIENTVPVDHCHVPISAHITAVARRTLYDFLCQCREVHYCDTDGFSTTDTFPTSTDLGELKLEKVISHGQFVAPKLYRLDLVSGKTLVKAKGFSLGEKRDPEMAVSRFMRLIEGQDIEIERMARLRELWRKGLTKPVEQKIYKRLLTNNLTKRFTYPDGETRPWHISEIRK